MLIVAFGVAVEDIDICRLPGEPMWVSVPRAYRGNIRFLLMQASRVCDICVFVSPCEKTLSCVMVN